MIYEGKKHTSSRGRAPPNKAFLKHMHRSFHYRTRSHK